MPYLIADKGYDANALRKCPRKTGTVPMIPCLADRNRKIRYDKARYKERHLVEYAFYRLKDFRRIATREACPRADHGPDPGDNLSRNFLSAVVQATTLEYWI